MEKGYIVLTPEKINDLFKDLEEAIIKELPYISDSLERRYEISVKEVMNYKKQELLKQLTK
jgi:hypothetical protein